MSKGFDFSINYSNSITNFKKKQTSKTFFYWKIKKRISERFRKKFPNIFVKQHPKQSLSIKYDNQLEKVANLSEIVTKCLSKIHILY